MERLTDKELVKKLQENYYGDHDKTDEAYLRLAELEDKIESGEMLESPCKVGDTVYRRHSSCYSEWTVTKINLYLSANSIDYCLCVTDKEGLCGDDFFAKDDEGYEWFLTKPQAEQYFKEHKNEN